MIKKTKKSKYYTIVYKGIIGVILLVLWIGLSLYFNSYGSLTILAHVYDSKTDNISPINKEIHKGNVVKGEFLAKEDNLGILAVRFKTYNRISNDILLFKIKELGQKDWYYQNTYKVNQFQPDELFTFGFPLIRDSDGKKYEFVLTSTRGKRYDAVAISSYSPYFVTKYQYPRSELLANPPLFVYFTWLKFLNSFSNVDFVISSFIYSIPLLMFLIWHLQGKYILRMLAKKNEPSIQEFLLKLNKSHVIITILSIIILLHIFLVRHFTSDVVFYILFSAWLLVMYVYQYSLSVTFITSFILYLISAILFSTGMIQLAERATSWIYYFLLLAIIHYVLKQLPVPDIRNIVRKYITKRKNEN